MDSSHLKPTNLRQLDMGSTSPCKPTQGGICFVRWQVPQLCSNHLGCLHKSTPQALAGMVLNSQNTRAPVLLWWWLCAEETLPTLRHGPPKAVDPAASASTTAPDFCCNPLRLSLLHFHSAQLSEFLIPPSPLCLTIPFTLPPAVDRIHPFCLPYTLFSVPLFDSFLAPNISRYVSFSSSHCLTWDLRSCFIFLVVLDFPSVTPIFINPCLFPHTWSGSLLRLLHKGQQGGPYLMFIHFCILCSRFDHWRSKSSTLLVNRFWRPYWNMCRNVKPLQLHILGKKDSCCFHAETSSF